MKYQIKVKRLLSGENISKCCLLIFLPSVPSVKLSKLKTVTLQRLRLTPVSSDYLFSYNPV